MNRHSFTIPVELQHSLRSLKQAERCFYSLKHDWILAGVFFDSSRYRSGELYVEIFLQPLFVPAETLVFNLGERCEIPSNSWNVKDPYSMEKLAAVLPGIIHKIHGAAESLQMLVASDLITTRISDSFVVEALVGLYSILGLYDSALKTIQNGRSQLNASGWQGERLRRYSEVQMAIENGDSAQVLNLLRARSVLTRQNLKENAGLEL